MNVNSLSRVNTVGKVNGYVEAMLDSANAEIDTVAKQFGRNVKIAQKGNRVFVNSGIITSSFDYKKMEKASDFKKNILNNLVANQKAEEHMELFEKKLNLPGLSQQISILKYVMVFLLFVLFFQIAYHVYQKRKYRKKLKSMMDEMKELYKDNQKSRQELAEQMKFYKQAYWNSRLMQSQQEEAKVQLLPFLQYRQQKWQETTDFLNGIFSNNELVDFLTKDLFIRKKLVENQVKIRELDIEISRYDKKNSLYRIQILREQYRLLQDNKACILRGLLSINRTIVKEIPSYARIKKRIKNPDKVKPLGKRDWKSMQKILHYFYPSLQKCLDEAGFTPLEQRYSYLSFFRLTNQENALWLGIPLEKAEETGRQIQEKLSLSQKKNALLCYLLTRY